MAAGQDGEGGSGRLGGGDAAAGPEAALEARMDPGTRALWQRILATPFLMSGGRRLEEVLAAETSLREARLPVALAEFRRFLLLAAKDGAALPPQLVADIARLYRRDPEGWSGFCHAALGRVLPVPGEAAPLHLDPRYGATLERYAAIFGEAPDRRVWPTVRRQKLLYRLRQGIGIGIGMGLIGFAVIIGLHLTGRAGTGQGPAATGFALAIAGFLTASGSTVAAAVLGPWPFRDEDNSGGMGDGGD